MYEHNNAYPIITPNQLPPREHIRVNPEKELDPLSRAELANIKKGVPYKLIISNTPANKEKIVLKTSYYQMVAYKEGWTFNPTHYQVTFVNPNTIGREHTRVYHFEKGAQTSLNPLSVNNNARFDIHEELNVAKRISNDETDGLVGRVLKLFRQ